MHTAKTIDPSTFAAMVASGNDEQCGLHGVRDLDTAKAIINRIGRVSDLGKLLRCIASSRYPRELLMHLMHVRSLNTVALTEFVDTFQKSGSELDFDGDASADVYDMYWAIRITERIQKLDFKRTWELVKKSCAPMEDHGTEIAAASTMKSGELLLALYAALCESGRINHVPESSTEDIFLPLPQNGEHFNPRIAVQYPGLEFARRIGGLSGKKITVLGRKVIAVAGYMNKVRRERERQKVLNTAFER